MARKPGPVSERVAEILGRLKPPEPEADDAAEADMEADMEAPGRDVPRHWQERAEDRDP